MGYDKIKFLAIEVVEGTDAANAVAIALHLARLTGRQCGQNFNGQIFTVGPNDDARRVLERYFPTCVPPTTPNDVPQAN